MDCPICYESDCDHCNFLCGHSFCYRCVKTWYQKGTDTCPLCRSVMCFRGIREMRRLWDDEMREKVLEEFVEILIEGLEESEYLLEALKYVYDRYNTLIESFPDISYILVGYILRSPHIKFDVRTIRIMNDIPTYMKNLMIPKTSYGVKVSK